MIRPPALTRRFRLVMTAVLMFGGSSSRAEDHLIAIDGPWPATETLAPGDRLLLAPGVHPARTVRDLPGTPERPIVITSADPTIPAAFAGKDSPAFRAEDCAGLSLSGVLIIGGGISVDASNLEAPSRLSITGVRVLPFSRTPGTRGPEVAIRVAGVTNCTLHTVGVNRWVDAAVEASGVETLELTNVGLTADTGSRFGVRASDCRTVEISGGGIVGAGRAAIAATGGDDAGRVTVSNMALIQPEVAVRVGDGIRVALDRCTIVDPRRAVVEFVPATRTDEEAARPAASHARLDRCLINWQVGRLERIFRMPDPPDAVGTVSLGRNLWWSEELPAVLQALGGFPDGSPEQVLDLNPRLIPRSWLPADETAQAFGHGARPSETPRPE